jgi:diadenylate cyclase
LAEFFEVFKNSIAQFDWIDIIDIIMVAVVLYSVLKVTSKTRAMQVLRGFGIILIISRICELLRLTGITWLLDYIINAGALVIVILFQPEIRRALERVGQGKLFELHDASVEEAANCTEALLKAVLNLSKRHTGALIVFEQKTVLHDVIESGTILNASISTELIESIFYPNAPLHDGAVIIKGTSIMAAGCFLPVSEQPIEKELGARHRAGLGISEISDSITIIISEETGIISIARNGQLLRNADIKAIRSILEDVFEKKNIAKSLNLKYKKRGDKTV